ncbi:hypothetical protein YC2023_052547 [Brassica napus]
MALLVPCPFAPLLLPPPPEPPPLVLLLDLPVECSPHVLSVPPHPPDLSLFLCRFFDSAVTILSVRLVTLSVSVVFVLVVLSDSFTAVCGFNSGQSLIENEVIALVGLGSHSSVLRFFSSNYVALAHSFSAVCRVLYVCDLTVEVVSSPFGHFSAGLQVRLP